MQLKHAAPAGVLGAVLVLVTGACGSRSTLLPGEYVAEPGEPDAAVATQCDVDEDCADSKDLCAPVLCLESRCVQRFTICNDGDPCTNDTCEATTGQCATAPATLDLDGDGFKGPLPGKKPGAADACGDDCDDTRSAAFPGNTEVCDSVDNDCNGVVDDGAGYAPPVGGLTDVRVSAARFQSASAGAIAHDGTRYFATYAGDDPKTRAIGTFLATNGAPVGTETRLVQAESDAYPYATVWTGDRYGVIWSDRRFGDYEMYFATFDAQGKKMAPGDVRLSNTDAFSIYGSLVWTGTEFVAAWQDGGGNNGSFDIVARRIGLEGQLLSEPTNIARGESPTLAVGRPGLGVVFSESDGNNESHVFFRAVDFALAPTGERQRIDSDGPAQYPGIRWNDDVFVVTWEPPRGPFQIFGATFDGLGNLVTPPRQMTATPGNARSPSIVALGDRLLMVYSDSRDDNQGYELYTQTYGPDLLRIGLPTRITNHIGDSTGARPISGPEGEIGVLFTDQRDGLSQAYFTRLVCDAAP